VVSTSTTSTPTPPEPQSVTWQKRAIRRALGDHMPAVYAPKAALGNSLRVAGAVEAVLTVQALRDGVVSPTLNLKNLDPEIELGRCSRRPAPRQLSLRDHQFLRHRRKQRRGGVRRVLTARSSSGRT
jgi:3-oxoacyl-(acyl-carrier-protein) synthase